MPKKDELTVYARAGFDGADNPHLATSPVWYAHALGAYWRAKGGAAPTDVRMGRGYSIRMRDMRFTITHPKQGGVVFERVE